jgi:hypothetical protein
MRRIKVTEQLKKQMRITFGTDLGLATGSTIDEGKRKILPPYDQKPVAEKAKAKPVSYERINDKPAAITPAEYGKLQEAFDHFKKQLFDGLLPDVFITYQRKAHSDGYFVPDRFDARVGKYNKGELALNPDRFFDRTDEQICSTFVRLMVKVWQFGRGTLPSRGYHNAEWAVKMKAIGLQPSSTGAPGGSETGQRMSSYIIPGGSFAKAYAGLAATGWHLDLQSAHQAGAKGRKDSSKTKFSCSMCHEQRVRGKPFTLVACVPCLQELNPNLKIVLEPAILVAEGRPTAAPAAKPVQSYERKPQEPVKRKAGRPKGSKNKPKVAAASLSYEQEEPILRRKRGRPKGSKNRPKLAV